MEVNPVVGRSLANVIGSAAIELGSASAQGFRLVPGDILDVFGWQRTVDTLRFLLLETSIDREAIHRSLLSVTGQRAPSWGSSWDEIKIPPAPASSMSLIDAGHDTLMTPGKSMIAVFQAAALSPRVDAGDLVDVFGFRRSVAALRWLLVERPENRGRGMMLMADDPLAFYADPNAEHWDPARPKLLEIERGLAAVKFLPTRASVEQVIVECDRLLNLGKVS
jgi:hypothetical protein